MCLPPVISATLIIKVHLTRVKFLVDSLGHLILGKRSNFSKYPAQIAESATLTLFHRLFQDTLLVASIEFSDELLEKDGMQLYRERC